MANGQNVYLLLVSHLTLRRTVGVLGFTFPMVLAIGCVVSGYSNELEESISAYYATNMRDVFVGILCTIGCFFYAYRGYDIGDIWTGKVACVSVIAVALCPSDSSIPTIKNMHYISALVLFATLSYISIVLFTKTDSADTMTDRKRKRNKVYKGCGYTMLVCIVLILVYVSLLREIVPASWKPIFWLETILLLAFGFSWLIKGETLWKDQLA